MELVGHKLRHRTGLRLSNFVSKFPDLSRRLRILGIKLNVYMPRLSRAIRLETLNQNDCALPPSRTPKSTAIRKARDLQEPLQSKFEGNVRPIRIPLIRSDNGTQWPKTRLISTIWPGDHYSYLDEEQYLSEYRRSHYAFSPKKGGWDTMRTIEIMFSDCIPIIPQIEKLPDLAMFGYPKTFLGEVWKLVQAGDLPVPDQEDHAWLRGWAQSHLTCEAQAKFLLAESGFDIESSGRVHFLDLGRMLQPHYVSMGLLVGLKRFLGSKRVRSMHLPSYLTSREVASLDSLYGRGFGYVGELSQELGVNELFNSLEALIQEVQKQTLNKSDDLIVIANTESLDAEKDMRQQHISVLSKLVKRIAIVYSGDHPLALNETNLLSAQGTLFVREFSP